MTELVRVERPHGTKVPLIFDSPHSGSIYPADFAHAIDRMTLRRSEDAHIEELFRHVTGHGATLIHALFPRCYVDPNRNEDDIDVTMIEDGWPDPVDPTSKTLSRGVGLIWKDMKAFGPIYARRLSASEIRHRIERCWRPYQTVLTTEIDTLHAEFGTVVHVNCHSMASKGDRTTEDGEVDRPDFVVGDRDGTTCAPRVTECVIETLRAQGYSVAVNDPYKGFELVRRNGRPTEGRHSVQIEVNRRLYMEEATLSKAEAFLDIEESLTGLTKALWSLAGCMGAVAGAGVPG